MPTESPELTHSCLETLDLVYACRPDQTDQAIENTEEEMAVVLLKMESGGQGVLL